MAEIAIKPTSGQRFARKTAFSKRKKITDFYKLVANIILKSKGLQQK